MKEASENYKTYFELLRQAQYRLGMTQKELSIFLRYSVDYINKKQTNRRTLSADDEKRIIAEANLPENFFRHNKSYLQALGELRENIPKTIFSSLLLR